jgi:hypothetical protein
LKWTAQSPIAHAFHPPQALHIPPNFLRHKQGRRSVPRPILRTQRGLRRLIVIWLIFWTGIEGPIRSSHCNSAKVSRRPNFAQNMHPNKRCRRSLARPNRTTPEYHDVDHGVALGRPRRFCVIAPIAFVGGIGGWCCRTWCAVVFAVVLRSCAGYFLFHVNKVHR